jgi:hypothetical protein
MTVSEYHKMLKDYKMEKYITLPEIQTINRLMHGKDTATKGDKGTMDFKDFCLVNLECSVLMFGRDPVNLGHLSAINQ